MAAASLPPPPEQRNLGDVTRAAYRAAFTADVAAGRASPLVVPYSLLGPFVVPTLWLAVPHARRPWLYRTRWLVVAVVVWFDLEVVRSTSSTNMACAYATGLMASWGIVYTLNLLVWTRPQLDAARIIRRPRHPPLKVGAAFPNGPSHGVDRANGAVDVRQRLRDERLSGNTQGGMRQRWSETSQTSPSPSAAARYRTASDAVDFVWQPFPADAPFLARLAWALDLTVSFRGSGWNWAISSIPRPAIPHEVRHGDLVDLDAMPVVSRGGYRRCLTESEFLWDRLRIIATCYVVLDFLAVFMMKDPYFILGPDNHYDLPPHLQHLSDLSPWLLLTCRQLMSLAAFVAAILGIFNVVDLALYYVVGPVFPIRQELWQFPSTFGSFAHVLDRGLAGWWGAWWHQTFRCQFLAPASYLRRHGYLEEGTLPSTLVALCVSFAQSGFLHAAGSMSSIPETKLWRAPAFFLLQVVGIIIQHGLALAAGRCLPDVPRWLFQTANLAFTMAWLQLTGKLFVDDIASTGLWLFEPVPISPLRWLGLGHPGDHWWRWDRDHFPKWHSGVRWWQSGIAL